MVRQLTARSGSDAELDLVTKMITVSTLLIAGCRPDHLGSWSEPKTVTTVCLGRTFDGSTVHYCRLLKVGSSEVA